MEPGFDQGDYRFGGMSAAQRRLVGISASLICIAFIALGIGPIWLFIAVLVIQVGVGIWMSTGLIEIRRSSTSLTLSTFAQTWTVDTTELVELTAAKPGSWLGRALLHNGLLTLANGPKWTVLCLPRDH